jgi:hypothetical protein
MTLIAVRETGNPTPAVVNPADFEEVMVVCPGCKAMQSVQISGKRLLPTRKFTQVGPYIYHDCGSKSPCRLYQNM